MFDDGGVDVTPAINPAASSVRVVTRDRTKRLSNIGGAAAALVLARDL